MHTANDSYNYDSLLNGRIYESFNNNYITFINSGKIIERERLLEIGQHISPTFSILNYHNIDWVNYFLIKQLEFDSHEKPLEYFICRSPLSGDYDIRQTQIAVFCDALKRCPIDEIYESNNIHYIVDYIWSQYFSYIMLWQLYYMIFTILIIVDMRNAYQPVYFDEATIGYRFEKTDYLIPALIMVYILLLFEYI